LTRMGCKTKESWAKNRSNFGSSYQRRKAWWVERDFKI